MEQFRERLRYHSDAAGWLAGRRAWSAVRTAAALDSGSVVRRTMRETRAQAAGPTSPASASLAEPAATTPTEATFQRSEHPEVLRLRAKLRSDDHEQSARGARGLLELTEPASLEAAKRSAFADAAATPAAEWALEQAWERFRHDRYRALN